MSIGIRPARTESSNDTVINGVTLPRPTSSPTLRGQAVARALLAFVEREHRAPGLVEIMATVANIQGHAGPVSVEEGEAMVHALRGLLAHGESSNHQTRGFLRAAFEVVFHNYPNSLNASPS